MSLESYLTGNSPYYDPRGVIYERKMFLRLAIGVWWHGTQGSVKIQTTAASLSVPLVIVWSTPVDVNVDTQCDQMFK